MWPTCKECGRERSLAHYCNPDNVRIYQAKVKAAQAAKLAREASDETNQDS